MKELIAMLKEVEGVDDVRLGRTAEEKRVVSQELELWISRVPMAEDSTGYNLVSWPYRPHMHVTHLHRLMSTKLCLLPYWLACLRLLGLARMYRSSMCTRTWTPMRSRG